MSLLPGGAGGSSFASGSYITKEMWLRATAPIYASYDGTEEGAYITEPKRVEFKEGGMVLTFQFHHAGASISARMVELTINGVKRVYNTGHDTSLVTGDTWSVAIMLPYE